MRTLPAGPNCLDTISFLPPVLQGIFVTFPERLLSNKYLLGPTFCVGPYFFSSLPSSPFYRICQVTFFSLKLGREGARVYVFSPGMC